MPLPSRGRAERTLLSGGILQPAVVCSNVGIGITLVERPLQQKPRLHHLRQGFVQACVVERERERERALTCTPLNLNSCCCCCRGSSEGRHGASELPSKPTQTPSRGQASHKSGVMAQAATVSIPTGDKTTATFDTKTSTLTTTLSTSRLGRHENDNPRLLVLKYFTGTSPSPASRQHAGPHDRAMEASQNDTIRDRVRESNHSYRAARGRGWTSSPCSPRRNHCLRTSWSTLTRRWECRSRTAESTGRRGGA